MAVNLVIGLCRNKYERDGPASLGILVVYVKFRRMKATGGEDQRVEKREKGRSSTRERYRDEKREKEMAYLLCPGGVACETAIHK